MYVLGIDPGPIAGIVRIDFAVNRPGENLVANGSHLLDVQALQVTPGLVKPVLQLLAREGRVAVAVERFIVGRRAARSSDAAAGELTRTLIGAVGSYTSSLGATLIQRSAAEVKPWATDKRLDAAGLLDLTKGMRHARDAARHALFCAVKDFGLADPLSRKAGATL